MLDKNVVKSIVLGIGGALVGVYALRSYGYQKESSGYFNGCNAMLEALTGNKTSEEMKKIIKENEPGK